SRRADIAGEAMDRTPITDANITHRDTRWGTRLPSPLHLGTMLALLVALIASWVGVRPAWAEPTVVEPVRPDVRVGGDDADAESQAFFDSRDVPHLRVDVGEAGLASLRKEPREPVRATVIERVGNGAAVRATV